MHLNAQFNMLIFHTMSHIEKDIYNTLTITVAYTKSNSSIKHMEGGSEVGR